LFQYHFSCADSFTFVCIGYTVLLSLFLSGLSCEACTALMQRVLLCYRPTSSGCIRYPKNSRYDIYTAFRPQHAWGL